MSSAWQSFGCPESTKRWRYLDDGRIEVEGVGTPEAAWPDGVEKWRTLILAAAARYGLPPAWIAATMAQETGGRNVCLGIDNRVCAAPCQCDPGEGAGVMAMLPSTATMMAGRKVTSQQLLNDPPLAIDLGAKLIRRNLDNNDGDYMRAAISYNAGSVRCGRGSTFIPYQYKGVWSKESCPNTGWGVVMGCIYSNKKYGTRCAPSTTGARAYVCSTDYPSRVVETQNAARRHFEGKVPAGPPSTLPAIASVSPLQNFSIATAGAIVGVALMSYLS